MASIQFESRENPSWNQWLERYDRLEQCHGLKEWKNQSFENGHWDEPKPPRPLELPQRVSSSASNLVFGAISRPRVFVSHRQGDEAFAKRIAALADREGFEYWLDVVNLPPTFIPSTMSARAIALQIEMALLNCSHIVAVYTDITTGSTWVPYEYGRVKEPVLTSTKCCAWLYTKPYAVTPEWLELNEKREHEQPLIDWFETEFRNWHSQYGCDTGPTGQWHGNTTPLP